MEGVRKQLSVGAMWTAGGRVVSNLLGVVSMLVLARLLSPADFGLVTLATIVLSIIAAITELSLSSALIQHKSPQREHYNTAWTLNMLRAAAIAVLLVSAGYPVAWAYQDDRLIGIFFALGGGALISGLVNPRLVDFRRRLSFHQEIFIELINRVVGVVVAVVIALIFRSYWALVIGTLASQVAGVIMSYVLLPYLPRISFAHWRNLFSFSGWVALSSGLNELNWRADQLALGAMLGAAPLGQYTVGDKLASLPVRETTAPIASLLFPVFARLQDDPERLRHAFLRSQGLLVAAALPVGIGFALVAEPFVSMVLGPAWSSAALVAQVLGAVFAIIAFKMPVTPLAMGLGCTRSLFQLDLAFIFVRFPLIFAGLVWGGLVGLLFARCISAAIGILMYVFLARRLTGVSVRAQLLACWRSIVAALVMAGCVWGVGLMITDRSESLQLAIMIPIGGIGYFGASFVLWLASGKPAGPEREALDLLQFVRRGEFRTPA
ncbi:lipopolysaccharide biosynthesis protein (plasmid) [Rhizobium indicum]|uniref:lipopolysaccharide biosynthesis protein n=1 Tax=Rhizobium TaxID=379 RepID=UPI001107518D|nr:MULTISPECIES: lipopolysaccharide biosynthesis protein [Rhizobium]MBA1345632.1 lipopolysaccharide biosynthesis protein [Rhizobium sp. WYCCWR 11146]NNU67760.1 lipopolysaccharide biosynthesis protein [Rhizobium sp. WYCCWR 11152]QKK34434.1 lipopolysaccharide biosynthesis protein [Rhizobium indicum]